MILETENVMMRYPTSINLEECFFNLNANLKNWQKNAKITYFVKIFHKIGL